MYIYIHIYGEREGEIQPQGLRIQTEGFWLQSLGLKAEGHWSLGLKVCTWRIMGRSIFKSSLKLL